MGLKTLIVGSRGTIAGTVYGTIVVLASVTAGAKSYEEHPWQLTAIVGTTVLVLWVAHVYSHGLGRSLEAGRRLTVGELAAIARAEFSIPLAAVLPMALLALGALDVLRERTAVWLALAVGVATLTAQGVRYAHLEQLRRAGTLIAVSVNLALGLAIVALKTFVAH